MSRGSTLRHMVEERRSKGGAKSELPMSKYKARRKKKKKIARRSKQRNRT